MEGVDELFIYTPPPSTTNVFTLSMFLNEFRQFLESHVTTHEPLLICEDLNFHLDAPDLADIFNLDNTSKVRLIEMVKP